MWRPALLLAAIALAVAGPVSAAEREFSSGIAGSNPSDARDRAATFFQMEQVRQLIERLERGPLREEDVRDALNGSKATVDDLIRTKILRQGPAGYVIGFNYFTLDDIRQIHAAADEYVPSLVAVYRAHSADFDRIFAAYPVKSVDRKALATVVIAGFALNWDALQSTREEGYRRPDLVRGPGWKYSFWAAEDDPAYSDAGFIWGSSTLFGTGDNFASQPVDFVFSSFGDPHSDPRMNFPDLFYLPADQLAPRVRTAVERAGLRDEKYAGFDIVNALGPSRARSVGPMLFALRKRPLPRSALVRLAAEQDKRIAGALVDVLVATNYIRLRRDGRFELLVPVLDRSDARMLERALMLHRRILSTWMAETYPKARMKLSNMTAVRQGVPFESAFTQIWHDFFGLATRQLAQAGVIADLNSAELPYHGSIPVLWRRSIYALDLG